MDRVRGGTESAAYCKWLDFKRSSVAYCKWLDFKRSSVAFDAAFEQ